MNSLRKISGGFLLLVAFSVAPGVSFAENPFLGEKSGGSAVDHAEMRRLHIDMQELREDLDALIMSQATEEAPDIVDNQDLSNGGGSISNRTGLDAEGFIEINGVYIVKKKGSGDFTYQEVTQKAYEAIKNNKISNSSPENKGPENEK